VSSRTARTAAVLVAAACLAGGAGCAAGQASAAPPAQHQSATAAATTASATAPAPVTTSPAAAPQTAPAAGRPPRFRATVVRLSSAWRSRLRYSWHRGCPAPLSSLALIRMTYWGFDKRAHHGRMIVNAGVAAKVIRVFSVLYRARYPIRRMRLVDAYHGSDPRSMNADNTSAFNCRFVPGSSGWSMHAYGLAIDINPCENPYIPHGHIEPARCAVNADRSRRVPGLIHEGDVVTRAFASIGWGWGGRWASSPDYQHFSSNGK
jgi:hypothetical protein